MRFHVGHAFSGGEVERSKARARILLFYYVEVFPKSSESVASADSKCMAFAVFTRNAFLREIPILRSGPVHANNRLALAARRAERKDCDEANTRRIREEHDAAIGPSGGQPLE
jgi:hypothetical protein